MRRGIFRGCAAILALLLLFAIGATAFAWFQARQTPAGPPVYVALGSSFAAGPGLGELQENSPLLCARSTNGYPRQLARLLKLPIADMSCGGATTAHLLHGGQFFQGPQVRVINRETRLVTITVGGNDVGYVGDIQMLAASRSDGLFGWLVATFWNGPEAANQRDYARFERDLTSLLRAIRRRAPAAKLVVASYPAILPPSGSCARILLTSAEVDLMREVGDRLAAATRSAAEKGGALMVDMNASGREHHGCSADPWTKGQTPLSEAPFHPTERGARATARMIVQALDHQQL